MATDSQSWRVDWASVSIMWQRSQQINVVTRQVVLLRSCNESFDVGFGGQGGWHVFSEDVSVADKGFARG